MKCPNAAISKSAKTRLGPKLSARGSTILELGFIGGLLTMLVMFALNLGFVILGCRMNDRACRDAARAAAQASNAAQALQLAQSAILAHQTDGYFISASTVSTPSFVYQDFAGNAPANTSPYVTVTTTNQVRIPAPVLLMGANLGPNGTLTFSNTYTFPIVKMTLYL